MKLKRLTAAQRVLCIKSGIPSEELINWQYSKTETISSTGTKSSSRNEDKTRYMVIYNTETKETRKIELQN